MLPSDWLLKLIAARPDVPIDPVRMQKGMFLLAATGAIPPEQRYAFEPYSYGPMSRQLYRDGRALETAGEVESEPVVGFGWRSLRPTALGMARAAGLPGTDAAESVREIVDERSFAELLEYVYARYPEYAARSVFRRS